MSRILVILIGLVAVAGPVLSQTGDGVLTAGGNSIPRVTVIDQAVDFQESVYPELYRNRSTVADMRWIARNDSGVIAFWSAGGDSALSLLRLLGGIEWQEREFPLYLVRYYRTIGTANPLVLPLGGIGDGSVMEAAPTGNNRTLTLLYLLAHRALHQVECPGAYDAEGIALHPLMQAGPYRRDCLALLLALSVGEQLMGSEDTYDAYNSDFWRNHFPAREVFQDYYRGRWTLSTERPLSQWLAAESYSSELVEITQPPELRAQSPSDQSRAPVERLPLAGNLGFSVKLDESNRLVVDRIDTQRLAYTCGLRRGDRIHRVEGQRPTSHRTLVEMILDRLPYGAAALEIVRDGHTKAVLLRRVSDSQENVDLLYGPTLPPADSLSNGDDI
jgi:hypothetical protein